MNKCKKMPALLATLLAVAASGLFPATASAQSEPRWYRIELLIFAHRSEAARDSETWEPTPVLLYPHQTRFLVDPALVEKNLAQFDATSELNERGHQTLFIIPPPNEDEEEIIEENVDPPEPATLTLTMEPDSPELTPPPEPELPTTPTPYVILANAELEFRGKAAYMERSGRYKTLFHETWVQPMAEQGLALPIVVDRSGDLENWPELQGSVTFFISRFLHVETNLWLNTLGEYLPQGWDMPAPPLGPKSLTVIYPPEPESDPALDPELGYQPIASGFFGATVPESEDEEAEALAEAAEPIYPWRHAVSLQQKRKMRSTEVHYIDHPMLGLVIKISPLSEEELQLRATAELALTQAEAEELNR